jgi:hypothetical protein
VLLLLILLQIVPYVSCSIYPLLFVHCLYDGLLYVLVFLLLSTLYHALCRYPRLLPVLDAILLDFVSIWFGSPPIMLLGIAERGFIKA